MKKSVLLFFSIFAAFIFFSCNLSLNADSKGADTYITLSFGDEALVQAAALNLDLVNISPNAAPPVCRIMDYGKYRYDQQKKEKEARKKQKTTEVKEMRLGIFTEEHDLDTKAKLVSKFLADGDKVKISMRFRGREMGYVNKGRETMLAFVDMVKEYGNIEKQPVLEGRNMSMVVAPKSEKEKQKAAKAAREAAKKAAEAAQAADAAAAQTESEE